MVYIVNQKTVFVHLQFMLDLQGIKKVLPFFEFGDITGDAVVDQIAAQRIERQIWLNPVEAVHLHIVVPEDMRRTNVLQIQAAGRCKAEHR